MTRAYQFVDLPSEDPEILLDLEEYPLDVIEGVKVSAPTLRRSTVQGIRQDGALELGSAYDERAIALPLELRRRVPAPVQAATMQRLAHLLDRRDGAWLKWQAEDMANPLFFRTHRASFETVDDVLDATPDRLLNVPLTADPFGYGLPEFGSAVITNDPTASDFPMLLGMPEIKGDVAAPLRLIFDTPDGVHKTRVASLVDYSNGTLDAPYCKSLSEVAKNASPPAGWAIADATDTSMVAGTRRRLTKTSGTALCRPSDAVMQEWDDLPVGDYRVIVRTGAAPAGTELLFFNRPPTSGSELIYSEAVGKVVVSQPSSGEDWFDLGVVAMPGGAPLADIAFGLPGAIGPALWNVAVFSSVSSMQVDLDEIMLIPAGRPGTMTRHGSVTFAPTYTDRTVTWDGQNYYRIANGISNFTPGKVSVQAPSDLSGGNPMVAPNASNFVHFLATVADPSSASRISDDKALTTTVNWMYYPRYLYNRPDDT